MWEILAKEQKLYIDINQVQTNELEKNQKMFTPYQINLIEMQIKKKKCQQNWE